MTSAMPTSETASGMSAHFLSFADHAMYLAHTATGQQAVIQALWRYRRPVDIAALIQFRDNLAQGHLARLIRPALLPFGRPQWIGAPPPSSSLAAATAPLAPIALQAWADAQVELQLDPERGPGWTFTIQSFADGSTVVSLVVSHCIADGMAGALAVIDAVRGMRSPLPVPAPPRRSAATLAAELLRVVQDAPATFRAITQLARRARTPRAIHSTPAISPVASTADDQTVVFPSAFIRVPTSNWDAKARSLGANRLTLLIAVTAAFAEALGRVRGKEVTLLIPVNQRGGLYEAGGNQVSLATMKVAVNEPRGRLHRLQRRLQATLLRTRREPDPLAALLPLAPFVPRRAFSAAAHLALGALADLPVTCSYMGELPTDMLHIDGGVADGFCFRGVDRQASVRAIEARQGVATLLAGVTPGFLHLNFVAYQPDILTESHRLRALVERLLANYDLVGGFFDG